MKESPLDQEEDNTASKKGKKESLGEEHGSWGRELANRRVTFGTAIREGRGVSRYPLFLSLPFAVCLPLIFFFLFSFRFASFFSSSLFPFPPFFFRFILLLCTWAAGDTCIDDFHLILLFRCVVQAFSFLRLVSLWFFFSFFCQLRRGHSVPIHVTATICRYPVVATRLWVLCLWC